MFGLGTAPGSGFRCGRAPFGVLELRGDDPRGAVRRDPVDLHVLEGCLDELPSQSLTRCGSPAISSAASDHVAGRAGARVLLDRATPTR